MISIGRRPTVNYKSLVRPDTYIGQYLDSMSSSETPVAYDFWSAIWSIGTAAGRGVYVNRPGAPVRLNWYILLVAESGTTRKSTAVSRALSITGDMVGNVVVNARTSPEHLEEMMADATTIDGHTHVTICTSELVTLLGKTSYIKQMPMLLTDLYDCPSEKVSGTKTSGRLVSKDVYLTFLSASTPSWLLRLVSPEVIEGGFTSRCLFIHRTQPKARIAWAPVDKVDVTGLHVLLRTIVTNAKAVGKIELNAPALDMFGKWYRKRPLLPTPYIATFQAREDAHILRLAACLCVNDGSYLINAQHMATSIRVIQYERDVAAELFSGTSASPNEQAIYKIVKILTAVGQSGITQETLNRKLGSTDRSRIYSVLDRMHNAGMVTRVELIQTQVKGRNPTVWTATAKLFDPKQQAVLKRVLNNSW